MGILIFTKKLFMDKTRTFTKKCLVNELVHFFWVLKTCAKFQSNPIILSRVIASTDARQTDTLYRDFRKNEGLCKSTTNFLRLGTLAAI